MGNIIILDVETARPTKRDMTGKNGIVYYQDAIGKNLVYDLGYMVCNDKGKIITKRNIVIKEIFSNDMFMNSAYYKDKIPQYVADIRNGDRKVLTVRQAKKDFDKLVEKYSVKKVYAYNCNFDKNALNSTMRYLTKKSTKEKWFENVEFGCIWNMACQCIMNTDNFRKFCAKNEFVSATGNYQTSAEICYRYINNETEFVEKHTGLEDVKIERQIFIECLNTGIDFDDSIDTDCWKIVQESDE